MEKQNTHFIKEIKNLIAHGRISNLIEAAELIKAITDKKINEQIIKEQNIAVCIILSELNQLKIDQINGTINDSNLAEKKNKISGRIIAVADEVGTHYKSRINLEKFSPKKERARFVRRTIQISLILFFIIDFIPNKQI